MSQTDIVRTGGRRWAGLGLLALPTTLLGLDVTVLYLVLPSMTAELSPSPTQTLWIMDAYGFFIAGFLITMGTLGDWIGRRRLLMAGMTAFAVVSVFAAFAPSASLLILARALLGITGATLMPSTLSLIANMFPEPRLRAVAIGAWATMFALGMAAGPIVGGALVEAFWWGAAFLLAVPVAIAVLCGARALLPEYIAPRGGRVDLISVALSLTAILPIVYAIKDMAAHGVGMGGVVSLVAGFVAAVVFVRRQRVLPAPLLDVTLFSSREFSAALIVLLIGLAGVGGTMYLVTQYLQLVEGLTPFAAGLWMGPAALAMVVAAIGAPVLARRIRPGYVMGVVLGISSIGYALLATAGVGEERAVVAGFGFVYLGFGTIAALGTDMVVGAAPATRSGSAAAMSETVQELGIALGVAVLGSLTTAVYRMRAPAHAALPPELAAELSSDLAAAVTAADELPEGALPAAQQAFTSGLNTASLVAGIAIVGAAVLCVVVLRHVPALDEQPHADAGRRGTARLPWRHRRGYERRIRGRRRAQGERHETTCRDHRRDPGHRDP